MLKKLLSLISTQASTPDITVSVVTHEPSEAEIEISNLKKQATKFKKEKKHDEACECLQTAISIYQKENYTPPADLRVRYAKYLQSAKRNDEGWREINIAISENPINYFALGDIHDGARIFLNREKRYKTAIFHGLMSRLYLLKAQYGTTENPPYGTGDRRQEIVDLMGEEFVHEREQNEQKFLTDQLEKFASDEALKDCASFLVKKTEYKEKEHDIFKLLKKYANALPKFDAYAMSQELNSILND